MSCCVCLIVLYSYQLPGHFLADVKEKAISLASVAASWILAGVDIPQSSLLRSCSPRGRGAQVKCGTGTTGCWWRASLCTGATSLLPVLLPTDSQCGWKNSTRGQQKSLGVCSKNKNASPQCPTLMLMYPQLFWLITRIILSLDILSKMCATSSCRTPPQGWLHFSSEITLECASHPTANPT